MEGLDECPKHDLSEMILINIGMFLFLSNDSVNGVRI